MMASTHYTSAYLAFILLLQIWAATSNNFLPPLLSPIFDDVCKEVRCGRGSCRASENSSFPFECECEAGWKHSLSNHDDRHLRFLPCVIPNCTLNYSCREAPSSIQQKENKANESFFDPCRWADCGGGTCNKTSLFTHTCNCQEGYYNLLNSTSFPCFSECAVGMDCANLGISMTNKSSSSPSSLSENGSNQALIPKNKLIWVIIGIVSLAPILWK